MTSKVLPSCWSNSHSVVVTSFSDSDGVVLVIDGIAVVVATTLSLLCIVVIEDDVDEEKLDASSSSGGNVGKEIDTLEPFKPVELDSSSSSSKGDLPSTLVPSPFLMTPAVLPPPAPPPPPPPAPPPRILRRTTGPRTRMTSAIIELTFSSIL